MKDIIEFLNQNKFGNLATSNDNIPDVRPFEYVYYDERGMFFYTSQDTELSSQLKSNHNICFCATDANYNYVKVSGSVMFSEEPEEKEKIMKYSVFAKDIFNQDNLNEMIVFYLPHGKCKQHFHGDNKVITDEF